MLNELKHKTHALFPIMAVIVLIGVGACTSSRQAKDSPAQTLSEYVGLSFAVKTKPERAKLMALSTGNVHDHIEKMSDADFKSVFEDSNREFVSLKIRDERKVQENEYSITYEITYLAKSPPVQGTSEPVVDKITNKKHALFKKENGHWLISDVKNIKTTIEHQNAISL